MPNNYKRMKERGVYEDYVAYTRKYQKENYMTITVKLSKNNSEDEKAIIEFLTPYLKTKSLSKKVKEILLAHIKK